MSMKKITESYTENWETLPVSQWSIANPCYPYRITEASKNYLRFSSGPSDGLWFGDDDENEVGVWRMLPQFVLSPNGDFTITVQMRMESAGRYTNINIMNTVYGEYGAVVLYNGEWNYFGLYWGVSPSASGLAYGCKETTPVLFSYDYHIDWPNMVVHTEAPAFVPGRLYTFKYVYTVADGVTKAYMDNGDGVFTLYRTRTFPWSCTTSIWISGVQVWGYQKEFTGAVDIGTVTIETAKPLLAGATDYYPWNIDVGDNVVTTDPRYHFTPPEWEVVWPNAANLPNVFAGPEGMQEPGGLCCSDTLDHIDDTILIDGTSYAREYWPFYTGSYLTHSPLIEANGPVRPFGKLKLWGKQRLGYVRVRIADASDVPYDDSVVAGNSTGFFPSGGHTSPLEIDLKKITDTAIKLEIAYAYTGTGDDAYTGKQAGPGTQGWLLAAYKLPSVLQGFSVEPGSPITELAGETASLALAGGVPSLLWIAVAQGASASLAVAANLPQIAASYRVTPPAGEIGLAAGLPQAAASYAVAGSTASLALAGAVSDLSRTAWVQGESCTLDLAAGVPEALKVHLVAAPQADLALAASAPTLELLRVVRALGASLALSGSVPAVRLVLTNPIRAADGGVQVLAWNNGSFVPITINYA